MATIVLGALTKVFPDGTRAVTELDLTLGDGELFTLIGPSGCGKSTVLRMVAGLEEPTAGTVEIAGRVVNGLPPRDRNLGVVLEHQTLQPHLTARGNIALPLWARRAPRREVARRVDAEARTMRIEDLLEMRPPELSAGQQQLVQTARALVRRPDAFLLDEPLTRVDPSTRDGVRRRLATAHERLGVTTLLVTSDQADAMRLSDRVGVLVDGVLAQVGPPVEVHDRPATTAVADALGSPGMNLLPAEVERSEPAGFDLVVAGRSLRFWAPMLAGFVGGTVILGVRPALVALGAVDPVATVFDGVVTAVEPVGHRSDLRCELSPTAAVWVTGPPQGVRVGDRVQVSFRADDCHLFTPLGEAFLHPL